MLPAYQVCSPICIVPPIALLRLGLLHGGIAFDGGEHYVRQSFRNRYHILTANGVKALSVPVKSSGGKHITTREVQIEYSKPWLREHIRSITAAYGSSPFYIHYKEAIEKLLSTRADTLGEFFLQTFGNWCALLGVQVPHTLFDHFLEREFHFDLRPKIKQPEHFPIEAATSAYPQVFDDRFAFSANLSVIDLLFNEGPAAAQLLKA